MQASAKGLLCSVAQGNYRGVAEIGRVQLRLHPTHTSGTAASRAKSHAGQVGASRVCRATGCAGYGSAGERTHLVEAEDGSGEA